MNAKELRQFEREIADLFKAKKIRCPIHLCGGNELKLIKIFKGIDKNDYIFSTHRNSYHYLLHTGKENELTQQILDGDSMHTSDPEHNFYSSSIVAGCVAMACGVALALKMKRSKQKVWCFIGDGGMDEGWFYEAWRYAVSRNLPITYVVEDNDRSVCASKKQRWGMDQSWRKKPKTIYYKYKCSYTHVGNGQWVAF